MRKKLVLTASGHDRVGIVGEITELIVRFDGNVEASRMVRHWGEFAMLVLITAPEEKIFFLPPTLGTSLESPAVEDVLLIRDEMANMAWAIERTVEGASGRPVDRFEAYQEKRRQEPPPEEPATEDTTAVYNLASTVPDHWIPLLPVHIDDEQRAIALQRGAMIDPETGEGILAQGRFLTPGRRLIIEDEEVPRIGIQAMRTSSIRVGQMAPHCFGWEGENVRGAVRVPAD